jgi:hypothetical protein
LRGRAFTALTQPGRRGYGHRKMPRVLLLLLSLLPSLAWAHAGSKSWLTLQVEGTQLTGQLIASQVDVALALRLDIRAAPDALKSQIAARHAEAQAYVTQGLAVLLNNERQALQFGNVSEATQNGEAVVVFELAAKSPTRIDALDVGYTLFFEDDVLHEALARFAWDDGSASEAVFRLGEPLQHVERGGDATPGFLQFLRSGIWHIWTGYDHVLFLLALLLPAVLLPARRAWIAAPRLPPALLRAATVVTAFTIAHSITLACAALGLIHLPERLVESAIALSVFIAAACNFLPAAAGMSGPWMAFSFGLLHGFGFAGVLAELVPDTGQVWRPLLGFNLGVELGQLAIVAVFFPLAWALRDTRFYRLVIVRGGSAVVCACAVLWFCRRAF